VQTWPERVAEEVREQEGAMNQELSWNGREIIGERVENYAHDIVRGHILKELKRHLQNFSN